MTYVAKVVSFPCTGANYERRARRITVDNAFKLHYVTILYGSEGF